MSVLMIKELKLDLRALLGVYLRLNLFRARSRLLGIFLPVECQS